MGVRVSEGESVGGWVLFFFLVLSSDVSCMVLKSMCCVCCFVLYIFAILVLVSDESCVNLVFVVVLVRV